MNDVTKASQLFLGGFYFSRFMVLETMVVRVSDRLRTENFPDFFTNDGGADVAVCGTVRPRRSNSREQSIVLAGVTGD